METEREAWRAKTSGKEVTLRGPPSPDYCAQETAPKEKYVQNWLQFIQKVSKEYNYVNLKNLKTTPETLKLYQSFKKKSMKKF